MAPPRVSGVGPLHLVGEEGEGEEAMPHTPGEWRTASDAQGPCAVMHPEKKGVAIAMLASAFKPRNGYHEASSSGSWPEERNANARLIAAAPKLLEVARDVLRYLDMDDADLQTADRIGMLAEEVIKEVEGR